MNDVAFAIGVVAGVAAVFVGWLVDNWRRQRRLGLLGAVMVERPNETSAGSDPITPHTRLGVLDVMNGKVLEVCSYKRNPHGPDWTTTYWIVDDAQPLAEQIALVLAMKGLATK